jgi:hypothetical protein
MRVLWMKHRRAMAQVLENRHQEQARKASAAGMDYVAARDHAQSEQEQAPMGEVRAKYGRTTVYNEEKITRSARKKFEAARNPTNWAVMAQWLRIHGTQEMKWRQLAVANWRARFRRMGGYTMCALSCMTVSQRMGCSGTGYRRDWWTQSQ